MSEITKRVEHKKIFCKTNKIKELLGRTPKIGDTYPGDTRYACDEITVTPACSGFYDCYIRYSVLPVGYGNKTPETFGTIWA